MAILLTAASIAYAAVLILVAVRITNGRHDLIPTWLMAPFGLFYEPLIWFLNDGGPASAFLNWLSLLWP
jgi:hypothetical protein